jgi:hypothetical protein
MNTQEPDGSIPKPGYHLTEIPKGIIGESSKILEEVQELQDAERQGIKVMQLCELSDIFGALEAYMEKNFPRLTVRDLQKMSNATRRAFANGRRK